MEKCENCGSYDQCEYVDGMILCSDCYQRRFDIDEYILPTKTVSTNSGEKNVHEVM